MSFRSYTLLLLFGTVCAWLSWLMILLTVHPQRAAWWGFALFYLTFFLSIFGTLTLASFIVRVLFSRKRATVRAILGVCLRHSVLWSAALIAALALQGVRLLTWWVGILVVVVFIALEYVIVNVKGTPNET